MHLYYFYQIFEVSARKNHKGVFQCLVRNFSRICSHILENKGACTKWLFHGKKILQLWEMALCEGKTNETLFLITIIVSHRNKHKGLKTVWNSKVFCAFQNIGISKNTSQLCHDISFSYYCWKRIRWEWCRYRKNHWSVIY